MPIFRLDESPDFPSPGFAEPDGLLAVGGDLSPPRLLNAYANGIFPWFSSEDPILWWSPDPRMVLLPGSTHKSGSMVKFMKKEPFRLTCDRVFARVVEQCMLPREKQKETWITPAMRDAYILLHNLGFAHSLEVWQGEDLVGGMYGIALGKCFFGESMFSRVSNASKFGFIRFSEKLFASGYLFLDCQVPSDHLKSLGACEISRDRFLELLGKGLQFETSSGAWDFEGI